MILQISVLLIIVDMHKTLAAPLKESSGCNKIVKNGVLVTSYA